jgi:hypothetical protein
MALTNQQAREAAVATAQAEVALQTMSKTELIAAVNAADQWCTDNAASYNLALPQPFRGASSTAQKAALLSIVALRRYAG